jgi:hemoglobin-like flavoprotein
MIDAKRLRADWARVAKDPGLDRLAETFYAWLFTLHPDARSLFPSGMSQQRTHLVTAIAAVVANVDRLEQVRPRLERLGRDHRRYGARPAHYDAVGDCLLRALAHHGVTELADWEAAYPAAAWVMIDAAAKADERGLPPYLDLVPVVHEEQEDTDRLHLMLDFPADLPAEFLPAVDGERWPVSAQGEAGMWVELTLFDHALNPDTRTVTGWFAHQIDPLEPGSLALLYLPDGATVRLGEPLPPAQEDPV